MTGRPKIVVSHLALLMFTAAAPAATVPALTGSIAGYVRDGAGVPQMGASVILFNRSERVIERALTNERGIFGFPGLLPGDYAIRVDLVSFVPALKQKIFVQPGMQSLLYINMASILSSIELVYAAPGQGALMSDDWRWTLKASGSTRPVLRALPGSGVSDSESRRSAAFSDTRGLLKVSSGDDGLLGASSGSELGTAFALATSFFGRNQLQVSGNIGHVVRSGVPAAALRTTFSREGLGPALTLTMRQAYLPARAGQTEGVPVLRTMSIATVDQVQITDELHLDYGVSLDSVSFLDRLNYLSPFARLSYDLGQLGTLQFAYSSGAPPVELLSAVRGRSETGGPGAELAGDLAALSVIPRVSLHDSKATVQRTQAFEFGYEKRLGGATVNLTAYRESTGNGAVTMFGPAEAIGAGDVLPEFSSRGSVVNIGSYERIGYSASVTKTLGDNLELGTSFGRGGALTTDQSPLASGGADELRSKIRTTQRFWASARASATLPVTGTHLGGSYQWIDPAVMMPAHFYVTQRAYPDTGLNVYIRQPIPSFPGMPGRLEATAELRNMLAEGYLPVPTGDNRRLLLIQSPRAVRGSVSFIF